MNEAVSTRDTCTVRPPRNATEFADVPARQSATAVLREHADRLRRDAGRMHTEADRLESLAFQAEGISGPAEQALYDIACRNSSPF